MTSTIIENPPRATRGGITHSTSEQEKVDSIQFPHSPLKKTQSRLRPEMPGVLPIATLPHSQLRLRRPLLVNVLVEGKIVGVWSEELEELGTGPHLSAAIADFQRSVVELYLSLEANQDRIGGELAALWQRLQQVVTPKR